MANKSNYWANVNLSGVEAGGATVEVSINGTVVPVSSFSMTYALNSIPQASAMVALGRNAATNERSAIYDAVEGIKQMAPVTVTLLGKLGDFDSWGNTGQPAQFPSGPAIIFTGYVSGLSYRRSAGAVALVINMINRLADLAMSSGGSKDVVPGTPTDFMLSTLIPGPGTGNAGSADTKFIESMPQELPVDFSKAILNALFYVSQTNRLQTHESDSVCKPSNVGTERNANNMAADVIQGSGDWRGIANYTSAGASKYVTSYPLQAHTTGYEKIAKYIGDQLAASMASTSMWGMLLGTALDDFGCAVIPMAQTAIIAPVLAMSRDYSLVIDPYEYADFDMSMQSKRPLYGVGVMGNYQMGTINDDSPKLCIGAAYTAKADNGQPFNDGMWMFVQAPQWMDDWMNHDPSALNGNADVNKLMGEVSHDNAGVEGGVVKRNPGAEVDDWNSVMEKYARSVYAANALRGREGMLVGKLRFDITPGMTVRINNKGDLLSGGVDTLAVALLGFVTSVTVMINAEQSSATTSLELSNLRTSVENSADRFSMTSHPFFGSNYFKYAPIVPGLSLPPVT